MRKHSRGRDRRWTQLLREGGRPAAQLQGRGDGREHRRQHPHAHRARGRFRGLTLQGPQGDSERASFHVEYRRLGPRYLIGRVDDRFERLRY